MCVKNLEMKQKQNQIIVAELSVISNKPFMNAKHISFIF